MAIGYACLTIGVPCSDLSRCILKNASDENLRKIIHSNLSALETMIDYNMKNDIQLFRISSDIIPFASHPVNTIRWWEDYQDTFRRIGTKIKQAGMRVSMHPGQYTVLNSGDERVVKNAIKELEYHARLLDALGVEQSGKLILHIGGVYGDKEQAMRQFITNYFGLPDMIKRRLVIENDDKNYNIQEVLEISTATGAPVVFDNLHHKVNPPKVLRSETDWIQACKKTWGTKDGKQKIHYSQQKENAPAGAHSDTICSKDFLAFYKSLPNQNIDIMLEVKDKNLSAVKCTNIILSENIRDKIKQEWERYEIFIQSRSQTLSDIVKALMEEDGDITLAFYNCIEKALTLPMDLDFGIAAALQIWEDYFRKDCTNTEKNRFVKLLREFREGKGTLKSIKNHLLKCAARRNIAYLVNSLYFYID